MKKILFWVIAGAAALATLSCQKEGADSFNGSDVKEVTTNFVLNVASAQGTKQDATTVQQNSNFRGIQDAYLYTHVTGMDGIPYVASAAAPAAGRVKEFNLGTLYAAGGINNSGDANEKSSSKRVVQLSLPLSSDAVLFYGKAINASPGSATGKTLANYSSTPADVEFSVCRRIGTDDDLKDYNATARLMIYLINDILSASVGYDADGDYGYAPLPALTWKDLGAQYEYNNGLYGNRFGMSGEKVALDPLEEILGNAYSTLTYIKDGEYRAGSSNAIKWMLQDMAKVVRNVESATPNTLKEANAKRLAIAIDDLAEDYFLDGFVYKSVPTIRGIIDEAVWSDANTGFVGARDLNDYPYGDFGIPEGAAQLAFNANTGKFSYLNPNKPLVNQANGTFDPRKYVYPSELFYYVNSPIRTTGNNSLTVENYPNGWAKWMDGTLWDGWTTPGKVLAETRGVAVRDNIRYGTALLKTSVTFGATTLYDNREAMTNGAEGPKAITASESGIQLKGILVGGVCARYGWQYIRKYETSTNPGAAQGYDFSKFDGVIYDDQIVYASIPTTTGSETYTLVYDNYDSSLGAAAQSSVFVALEFANTGGDFWGKDNLIRSGATFYLVAELVNDETHQNSISWPSDHQIPPVYLEGDTIPTGKALGQSKQIPRVFIQDFMTTATFSIGPESLKKAYFSMPDLRSTQMSLGLSVNLKWEPGYTYSVTL